MTGDMPPAGGNPARDRLGPDSGQDAADVGGPPPDAPPSVKLPKGGGAISGLGETFTANPVTGTGSISVPVPTSPGRSGFGPNLTLGYDSGQGNGPFGFGWSLSAPAIARRTDRGLPRYADAQESDVFLLSGAEDLVPVLDGAAGWERVSANDPPYAPGYRIDRYRPRTEGLFARIERWTRLGDGDTHWRSVTRDNVTTLYGRDANSRVFDPADPTRVYNWLVSDTYDDKGNAAAYEYKHEDSAGVDPSQAHERNRTTAGRSANRYLKRVRYGNRVSRLVQPDLDAPGWMFEVVLDYGEHDLDTPTPLETQPWSVRPDPFSSYRAGFEVRTYRLCRRILMFHHFPDEPGVGAGCLVRSLDLAYAADPLGAFLCSATASGYRRVDGGYLGRSMPPLEFSYSPAELHDTVVEVDPVSLANLPEGLSGDHEWVDLDGEGVSGILARSVGGWAYTPNLGEGRFGPLQQLATQPAYATTSRPRLLDLAGDGRLDLVELAGPTPGFYERTDTGGWSEFAAFESLPVIDWDDPNLRLVDVDGDGHADVLITEQHALTWYPSRAEGGFGAAETVHTPSDEERGPRLVFADGTQSVHLADMSGDGLADLVRITNGAVCYWPNQGYGRFGPRICMDFSPWLDPAELFDQSRIRLADVDGSGVTDLLYVGGDGVRVYLNQSGNSWSGSRLLVGAHLDDPASVAVLDLLGAGTACLVWSSGLPSEAGRQLRYVDLMGGRKPHLLDRMRNNLGIETKITYAPSTRFYLADKAAGQPWVTRLPFPVHVVERVETRDHVSRNRFLTRYGYHHGHFDGAEREFRGFGLVEQWDTEQFSAFAADDVLATNVDETSHVPPVLTRTWFHTGAWPESAAVSRGYESEYAREPGLSDAQQAAMRLADTVLPDSLSGEELAEALRGSVLRQEIYAVDGTTSQDRPYRVTERNYTLELLQPRAGNRHAVFFVHARETLDFAYERAHYLIESAGGVVERADPRVTHDVVLAVDPFGNLLRRATVGYGRRYPAAGFGREIQRKALVEPGPIVDGGAEQDPRWVTTGWTVVNNKGAPVRQYEPFFSSTHGFEFGYAIGVSPVLGYDPLDRLVATLTPHDCYEKVVFDPWHSVRSDAIDTVLDDPRADPDVSGYLHAYLAIHIGWQTWHARRAGGALGPAELAAAVAAAAHARTPTTAYLDSLGRTFLVVADGGSGGVVATRTELDITGVARRVVDARGVQVLCQDADLVGSILHTDSPDAGQRWTLPDVLGATVRGWDSRGQALRRTYDALRRPVELWVRGPDDVADILAQLTRYGEEHPEATERNLRGRPYLAFDCAGLATALEHDFKGNLLTGRRELAQTYHATPDWSALAGLTLSEVENAAATLLAGDPFTTSTDFDALNRTVLRTLPDTTALLPAYNEAGLLESVSAQLPGAALATPFVTDLDYDARGQRRLLEYGNGTHSAYEYDPATFRLVRLRTVRGADALQDLRYTYDPVGNIVEIRDEAQPTVFFAGQVVAPTTTYSYDAFYRLTGATGREHASLGAQADQHDPTLAPLPHPNDAQAVRAYTEAYDYDEVGNLLAIAHQAGPNGSWTRRHNVAADSNRLLAHSLPADPDGVFSAAFEHDAHGNMIAMPHLPELGWDFADRLQSVDLGGGGAAFYTYDSDGMRVRKVIEHLGGLTEERIYLAGYEVHRRHLNADLTFERHTAHISDNARRIALVETTTTDGGAPVQPPQSRIRYQLGNHLGSCNLEVDQAAAVVSYEEYHPYGSTALWLAHSGVEVSERRYRYIGKERDSETGLYACGARYYAPWLGRWTAADPAGFVDGANRYAYARDNPIKLADPAGRQAKGTITVETEVRLVNKRTGRLETVSKEKYFIIPEVTIEGDPKDVSIETKDIDPSQDNPDLFIIGGSAYYTGREAHLEPTEGGGTRTVIDPTDEELMGMAVEGMAKVMHNWVEKRTYLGMGTGMARWVGARSYTPSFTPFAATPQLGADADVLASAAREGTEAAPLTVLTPADAAASAPAAAGSDVAAASELSYTPEALEARAKEIHGQIIQHFGLKGRAQSGFTVSVTQGKGTPPVVSVTNPKYYEALLEGKVPLKEGEMLGSPIGQVGRAAEYHAEIVGVWDSELLGATGGHTGSSIYACGRCGSGFFHGDFPGWTHVNPNPGHDFATTPKTYFEPWLKKVVDEFLTPKK